MNKRIRRVYGQNLNDTVCVVDPVMRGLGVDLDTVARIQAVFAASRYTVRIPSRT